MVQQISLKEMYSVLAFRYVPKQNGKHAGLLTYISKRLTSAYQAKPYDVYLHDLSTGNTLTCPSLPTCSAGWEEKGELNLFIPQILLLVGCMGGEQDVFPLFIHTSAGLQPAS